MTIYLPDKKYYSFLELAARFQCGENDLRHLLVNGKITPSVFLEGGFYCDYQIHSTEDKDGVHLWPSEILNFESKNDELGTRTQLFGFHYLIFARRISAIDCAFNYASKDHRSPDGGDI